MAGTSRLQFGTMPWAEQEEGIQFDQDGVVGEITENDIDNVFSTVSSVMKFGKDDADTFKGMLVSDSGASYRQVIADSRRNLGLRGVVEVSKKPMACNYLLTPMETEILSEYAPEYRLVVSNQQPHDHAIAAVMRTLDHALIESRLPAGGKRCDIGGDPMRYVRQANKAVHVCGPKVDVKDYQRDAMRRMEAQTIKFRGAGPSADLATQFLNGDPEFACNRRAQECSVHTPLLTSIHVYDIPMSDWPLIMERKKAHVVEGCILFDESVLVTDRGQFPDCGALFEVDREKDVFSMGFKDSSAWWYTHKYSEYVRYGTDQMMIRGNSAYHYSVVERRKSTVFFRILRVRKEMEWPGGAHVANPKVHVAEVKGVKMPTEGYVTTRPQPATYLFPADLWTALLEKAIDEYEKHNLTLATVYQHYRGLAVQHTINGVVVAGNASVPMRDMNAIVLHACLHAVRESEYTRKEVETLLDTERQIRETPVSAALARLWDGPDPLFKRWKRSFFVNTLGLDWAVPPKLIWVDAMVMRGKPLEIDVVTPDELETDMFSSTRMLELDIMEAKATSVELAAILQEFSVREVSVSTPQETVAPQPVVAELISSDKHDERVAAIREYIAEVEQEMRAVTVTCQDTYHLLFSSAKPRYDKIRQHQDTHKAPDIWRFEDGKLVGDSVSGRGRDLFNFSGAYVPANPMVTRGVYSVQRHADDEVCFDFPFSGYAMTTDSTVVWNGVEVLAALREALELRHDYHLTVENGPPGCGKTYSIVQQCNLFEDVVLCAVRESTQDTRDRVIEKGASFSAARERVRTFDSFLVNRKSVRLGAVARMLADECYMVHSGKLYAAAALLGVRSVLAFGDRMQIPHIPRVECSAQHVRVNPDAVHDVWVTRRCPVDATMSFASDYGDKVRTMSSVVKSMSRHYSCPTDPPRGTVLLGMKQDDKKVLREKYKSCGSSVRIMTTHEAQGKTFENVWLHRFDIRKRSDKSSLYDQRAHVLVAMSRHTKEFKYICANDLEDEVDRRMKLAGVVDLKYADVETAGSSL